MKKSLPVQEPSLNEPLLLLPTKAKSKQAPCPKNQGADCHCWGTNAGEVLPDLSQLCVHKLFADKMKDMDTSDALWHRTWPQNTSVKGAFKPSIAELLMRDSGVGTAKSESRDEDRPLAFSCVPSTLVGEGNEEGESEHSYQHHASSAAVTDDMKKQQRRQKKRARRQHHQQSPQMGLVGDTIKSKLILGSEEAAVMPLEY